jgi:putative DNA primase/helicase
MPTHLNFGRGGGVNAEIIAKAFRGCRSGAGWVACCPAHDDRTPSLSLRDAGSGIVLVRCHAGCEQDDVIAALRSRGLWPGGYARRAASRVKAPAGERQSDQDDSKRTETALGIWRAATPAPGTPVETYLLSRDLCFPASTVLRFYGGLKHPSGSRWPAMVALVTRGSDGKPVAIHRTFIALDGVGKAPVDQAKMMLGPCRGGVVRLARPSHLLMVGEGIETCLAAMQVTGHPAWAALSTSGMCSLDLPKGVGNVIVLADGDDGGEAAAQDCARRWKREGRRVRIARPPRGMDFNDLLMGRSPASEERAA